MGKFAAMDIENRERETIGVCLDDMRTPPRYFRWLEYIPAHMGVIYCEPLDDLGAIIPIVKSRFWPLT